MTQEFIPYEQALELKKLGFNEECLGYYNIDPSLNHVYFNLIRPFQHEWCLSAPLYQQSFRWFREKGYRFTLSSDYENGIYFFDVWKNNQFMFETDYIYNTYEEAELACLKKLIEIVKNK